MTLIKLVSNLDNHNKMHLLGEETSKILRYTFSSKDSDVIDSKIVDEAVCLQKGVQLVNNKKLRKTLLEYIPSVVLREMGVDHQGLMEKYLNNISLFIDDFEIEDCFKKITETDSRSSLEYSNAVHGISNGSLGFPHYYQLELKKRIQQKLNDTQNPNLLVTMPTGAGKTVLAMEVLIDVFRNQNNVINQEEKLNIVWLVDSQELSEQSLNSFLKYWRQKGDREVITQRYFGKFNSINHEITPVITFATFDLVTERLATNDMLELFSDTCLLIIDEAHGANALTYSEVIRFYKNHNVNHRILGFTATPFRNDDSYFNSIKGIFQTQIQITDSNNQSVESPILKLQNEKYLSKLHFYTLNPEKGNSLNEYYKILHNNVLERCKDLIQQNKNTIIFAESKSHAITISIYLKKFGITNGLIIGETHPYVRKKLLEDFGNKSNNLNVLVNHNILSTGIDVPGMNSIMVLGEISSPTLALQILGRSMRGPLNGGNDENIVFLTKDNFDYLHEFLFIENRVLNN
jgi:superfamily II DNA or RNA helicase